MPGCTFYQNIEVDRTTEEFKDFMCQNSSSLQNNSGYWIRIFLGNCYCTKIIFWTKIM